MKNNKNTDLIIGVKANNSSFFINSIQFQGMEFSIIPLSIIPPSIAEDGEAINLYLAQAETDNSSIHPWDLAHYFKEENKDKVMFVEPDLDMKYVYQDSDDTEEVYELFRDRCQKTTEFLKKWPHPDKSKAIWHLDKDYSQLKDARDIVMNGEFEHTVRIAHFDTGYSNHELNPLKLKITLGKSFIRNEDEDNASDPGVGGLNPGHGTGTMGILAGKILNRPDLGFNDYLGGAPFAEVVPFRISKTVALIRTSNLVAALDYVIKTYDDPATRCDIITMSMGGLGTWALTAKVNELYEKGIFMVSATGNNFGGKSPSHVIYPARYNRVIGAAGITYDQKPYYKDGSLLDWHMQGNFGPLKIMRKTVMAGYSPNLPWPRMNCGDIRLSGGGTSAATPQIAAAAAIYLRKYRKDIDKLQGWEKVEAIKNALFNSAKPDNEIYFGKGILRANDALVIEPDGYCLNMEKKDRMLFPITWPAFVAEETDDLMTEMLQVEITQLIQLSGELQKLLASGEEEEEKEFVDLSKGEKELFIASLLGMEQSSQVLKNYLIKYRIKLLY